VLPREMSSALHAFSQHSGMQSAARVSMSPRLDLTSIATRIRALLIRPNGDDLEAAASRLDVAPAALSRSLDPRFPRPSLSVITAIVREYGVDPWWLMYGDYNRETHALASEMGSAISRADVLRLVAPPRETRAGESAEDPLDRQLGV